MFDFSIYLFVILCTCAEFCSLVFSCLIRTESIFFHPRRKESADVEPKEVYSTARPCICDKISSMTA